jgi:hypothetical protein
MIKDNYDSCGLGLVGITLWYFVEDVNSMLSTPKILLYAPFFLNYYNYLIFIVAQMIQNLMSLHIFIGNLLILLFHI